VQHATFQAPEPGQLAGLLPFLEIESFIAQGGMGAVYKGRQRSLDRDVAVKVLPRELGADPAFHASFATEAKAMARLNHPNLIAVYDFGDVEGMPYIVMEYVNGKSLFHSAWNKRIDPQEAVRIAAAICRGLAHAHENGVIHRDIKPANILLTPKAEPKIGDFGLARPAGSAGPGLAMGTPGYTAPEILRNPDEADARSDLYAVGVILHELLTGQPPDASASQALVPTGNLRLDALWRKATMEDPARRYAGAAEMAAALEGWLRSAGPALASAAAAERAGTRVPPPPVTKRPGGGAHAVLIRNLVIIAALLVAIGITAQVYFRKKQSIDGQRSLAGEDAPAGERATAARVVQAGDPAAGAVEIPVREAPVSDEPPAVVAVKPADEQTIEPPAPDREAMDALASAHAAEDDPPAAEEPGEEVDGAAEAAELVELRARARQVVEQAMRERNEKLAANAKAFAWDLDFSLRGLTHRDRDFWLPHVESLKRMVRNERVPAPEDVKGQASIQLSEPMAKVCGFYHQKQREIDAEHQAKMLQLRDAYVVRLRNEAAAAGGGGLTGRWREAERDAADLETWAASLAR